MTDQFVDANKMVPITPPPELVAQWVSLACEYEVKIDLATEAARWGADQELEACCEVLARELICDGKHVATDLHAARRPKPPNKKQRGLTALEATSLKKDDPLLYQEILNAIKELPDD